MTSSAPLLDASVASWIDALVARHTASLTRPEFLKAVRALSARYVERRAELPDRSPLDSAGKRAAFAGFFAPLHFLTTWNIVRALGASSDVPPALLDLGCGTGVVSAAWAMAAGTAPELEGVDLHPWALNEARWNWQTLGLRARSRRGNMVEAIADQAPHRTRSRASERRGIVLGWSVNELTAPARDRLLPALLQAATHGDAILVIEPLARFVTPWWPEWQTAVEHAGGRADEWKFPADLAASLRDLDEAAGFRREDLGARTLWIGAGQGTTVPGSSKTR